MHTRPACATSRPKPSLRANPQEPGPCLTGSTASLEAGAGDTRRVGKGGRDIAEANTSAQSCAKVTLSSPSPTSASIVIVAFHRPESLQRLLAGLVDTRLERVVVNVESDPAVATVAIAGGARLVGTRQNVGFAAAVNLGAVHASSRVVIFTNDDVVAEAETMFALAAATTDGVHAPQVLTGHGIVERTVQALPSLRSLLVECALTPDDPPGWATHTTSVTKWRLPTNVTRVPAVSAVVVAVPTALLHRMPLPESYFLYWEESEWFWALNRAGIDVWYHPTLTIRHAGGRMDVRPEKSRLLARNAVRCIRRTGGRVRAAIAWPIVVAWQTRLFALDGLRLILGRLDVPVLDSRRAGLIAALRSWEEVFR